MKERQWSRRKNRAKLRSKEDELKYNEDQKPNVISIKGKKVIQQINKKFGVAIPFIYLNMGQALETKEKYG